MLSALLPLVLLSQYARFAAGEEIYGINGNYTSPAITKNPTACGGEGWVGDGQIGFRQSFSGIRLQMYFVTAPDGAIGNIFLDSNRVGYIRTFNAQADPSACIEVLYDTGTLLQGSHVVDVYNAGKDPDSVVVNATLRFHKAVITGPQDITNPASITGVRPTTIATSPLPSTFLTESSFSSVPPTSPIVTPSSFNLFTFTTSQSSLSSSTSANAGAATESVTPPSTSKKSSTGPVVGGIVGGLALLAFVAFLYFLHRRRGKKPEAIPPYAEAYTVPGGPANQINFSVGPAVQPEIQPSNDPSTMFNPYNNQSMVQPGHSGGFTAPGVAFGGYAPSTQPTSYGVVSPSSTDLSSSNNPSDEKSAAAMAHRPSPPLARNSSAVPLMSDLSLNQRAVSSQLSRQQMEVVQSLLARGVSGSAIDAVINGMVEENQQGGSSMARTNSFMAPPPEYRPAQ